MDQERWGRLQDLLQEAWSLPPRERATYLEEHCDDPDVRQRAEALLTADEEAEGYFERAAATYRRRPRRGKRSGCRGRSKSPSASRYRSGASATSHLLPGCLCILRNSV